MSGSAAASCLFACGCACWVLSDFSRPMMMVDGKPVLGERPAGLRLVPLSDLEFKVVDQNQGFAVIISSSKWTIEGCGTSAWGGEIIISSICGTRNPKGGELIHRETGSRADYRIFVEDARGKRHPIP
jgi:hypothetical protein